MSTAASPAFPPAPLQAERYNFLPDLACPRCFRGAGALVRPAADGGLYRCAPGCNARFRFEPATDAKVATLVRVLEDTPANAGARIADDCFCPSCGRRGFIVVCPSCAQDLYSGGRR